MADLLNLSLHIFTIPFFLILATLVACNGSNNEFESCSTLISCGKLENVGYPFWGHGRPSYCGHPALQLYCPPNKSNDYPWINGDHGIRYYVYSIHNSSSSLKTTIQLQEYSKINSFNNSCPFHPIDNDLKEVFQLSETVVKMYLFYDCPKTNGKHGSITCRYEHRSITANYLPKPDDDQFKYCKFVAVPVLAKELNFLNSGEGKIQDVLKQGYEVDYLYSSACFTCQDYGGICGSSIDKKFVCFPKHHKSGQRKLIIGLAIPGAFLMLLVLNVSICCCMKPKFHSPKLLSKTLSYIRMNSDIETGSLFHGIPIFSYSELQEATNNFSVNQELGHGGFGIVYQGKLRDGREVAVKRLYEKNYKQIGQFINEIEIFTRLHHNNLVKLHGCTTRHSRELLLVYEFITNGTVADHLHGNQKESGILSWDMRMKIATESASALSYLHASDIIHRDVKTNNILLDNHFSVKVADFGLSRLFPFETTHVSTAPQGTPGYLDPDYNKCYQVTNKSDVYSFGVVLVELISSLPAVDISRQEDEINLSDYAMNRIQHGRLNELVDHDLGFESDFKVKKMITLVAEVAFQCLQQNKELRPSMDEVLNALKQIESMDYYSQETEQNPSREISKQTSMPRGKEVSAPSTNFKHLPSPNSVMENWNSKSSASY